jgi:type VI secretion system protein VasD
MNTLHYSVVRATPADLTLRRRSLCGLAIGIVGTASLTGCAGLFSKTPPPPPPPKPGTLAININASNGINPNANNRPSPVVVRLYELKASAQFESADFLSLYDKDQSVLGADIVVRDEFVLAPGEKKAIAKPLAADTKFIGVVAAFRDLERARWRALVAVLPNKNNVIAVNLDGIAVLTTASAT